MAGNKTTPNDQDVEQFLNSVADEQKRQDSFTILELMKQVTGLEPRMWGSSIIGFGSYHYRYESGQGLSLYQASRRCESRHAEKPDRRVIPTRQT